HVAGESVADLGQLPGWGRGADKEGNAPFFQKSRGIEDIGLSWVVEGAGQIEIEIGGARVGGQTHIVRAGSASYDFACSSAKTFASSSMPAFQPLPMPSIAAVKQASSTSLASCGVQVRRIRVRAPSSSNVTVVSNTRGQSGIFGLRAMCHSASALECSQTKRSGGTTSVYSTRWKLDCPPQRISRSQSPPGLRSRR